MRPGRAARLLVAGLAFVAPALVLSVAATTPAALAATAATATAMAATAAATDGTDDSFTADFYLGRDAQGHATLRVVETLVLQFPEYNRDHGFERAIPISDAGIVYALHGVSVTDANGNSVPYSRTDDDGFAILRVGSASSYMHGEKEFRIEYTQKNAALTPSDGENDEFYRDVNGTGWSQSFGDVSATVHLEDGLAEYLTGDTACYRGAEGSTTRCTITRTGDTFTAQAQGFSPRQGMTIAIGFSPSTFAKAPNLNQHWAFAILPWVLLGLTAAAFVFSLVMRNSVWRDAKGRGVIIPQYSAPKGMYPMLAAEILRQKQAALPAQIVRFAVAKVLVIRERPDKPQNKRYQLELIAGWPTVPKEEEWVLKALFNKLKLGSKTVLDPSDEAIGDRLAKQKTRMSREVDAKGWRARPKSKVPRFLRWMTFGIAAIAIGLRFIADGQNIDPPGVSIAAFWCVVGWLVVSIAIRPPNRITDEGAEVRDYLYGIRDYIALAEADRIRVLQAPGTAERIDVTDESAVIKLYEKLLPYAMIFGIEDEWISELGRHYSVTEQPDWYTGGNHIRGVGSFSRTYAATSFATTPPSTSGSSWSSSGGSSSFGGSSGGGFSGGGSGGGGGGRW